MVQIAYHGLPRTWKNILLMQGFNEQEANIATLLDIPSALKPWKNGLKATSPVLWSVIALSLRNKCQKTGYFCKYHHQPNKFHSTKVCTACKAILQSASKSCEEKHGSDNADASSDTTNDYKKFVSFNKPPGTVRLKKSICKLYTQLPLRRLQRNTLQERRRSSYARV